MFKTDEEILNCTRPEDLFSMNPSTLEQEKNELLRAFEPKDFKTVRNFSVQNQIITLYRKALDSFDKDDLDGISHFRIQDSFGNLIEITYTKHWSDRLCEVFVNDENIIFIVGGRYSKYFDNYVDKTSRFLKPDLNIYNQVRFMLPVVCRKFQTSTGDYCIVVKKPTRMYTFRELLEYFDGGFEPKYVASIVSRLLMFVNYLNMIEMNHNGITIDNLFFSPGKFVEENDVATIEDIRIVGVYGGWFFSTLFDEKLNGLPAKVKDLLQNDEIKYGYSSYKVDILSIKEVARELLGKYLDETPAPMRDWVLSKSTEESALKEYKLWEKIVIDSFGKREFADMRIPIHKKTID